MDCTEVASGLGIISSLIVGVGDELRRWSGTGVDLVVDGT